MIEQTSCGGAPKGMPQRARTMFGKVLGTMTASERRNVQEECSWSCRDDVPEQTTVKDSLGPQYSPNSSESLEEFASTSSSSSNRSTTAPLNAARQQRRQLKQQANESGSQYGVSKHAVDDDEMWSLMSDTMVLKNSVGGSQGSPLRLSPLRARPSTVPATNPLNISGSNKLEKFHVLRLGISSPSFYSGRPARREKEVSSTMLTQQQPPIK